MTTGVHAAEGKPRQNEPDKKNQGIAEPEERKLPGVPSHLQAAVQQLIGADEPRPSTAREKK